MFVLFLFVLAYVLIPCLYPPCMYPRYAGYIPCKLVFLCIYCILCMYLYIVRKRVSCAVSFIALVLLDIVESVVVLWLHYVSCVSTLPSDA